MPNVVSSARNDDSQPLSEVTANDAPSIATRIARRTNAEREAGYELEVRRLLDAGRRAIRRFGTTGSPRVVDILDEAGLSVDVFYRHFRSKDELVTTILEEGTSRMHDHLVRQIAEVDGPADQIRRWVTIVMSSALLPDSAAEIRAVMWNGARVVDDTRRRVFARELLAGPLHEPLTRLGSEDPARDALLVSHATLGRLEEFIWLRQPPTPIDIEHVVTFGLRAVGLPGSISATLPTQNDSENAGTR